MLKHPLQAFLSLAFLFPLLTLQSHAAESIAAADPPPRVATERPDLPEVALPTLAEEIGTLIEDETKGLEALQDAMERASSIGQILQLQRQMQQLKLTTELNMLQAQLRHLEGPTEALDAEQLQAAIESLREIIDLGEESRASGPLFDGRN